VSPLEIAFEHCLDGGSVRKQFQAGSPDRDYLWLERLTSNPIDLSMGSHTITLEYGGADPTRSASIDGFLLIPAKLIKQFSGPGGKLTLTYDIPLGQLSIEEK
jgi:hypothetical protein